MKDLARFKAGTATAQVVVAPVTGSFSVSNANINCGQTSTLNWQSTDSVDTNDQRYRRGAAQWIADRRTPCDHVL